MVFSIKILAIKYKMFTRMSRQICLLLCIPGYLQNHIFEYFLSWWTYLKKHRHEKEKGNEGERVLSGKSNKKWEKEEVCQGISNSKDAWEKDMETCYYKHCVGRHSWASCQLWSYGQLIATINNKLSFFLKVVVVIKSIRFYWMASKSKVPGITNWSQ